MGVVADTFWRQPGVLRSDSPHAFAAAGSHAREIPRDQPVDIPHGPDSPVGRVHDLGGLNAFVRQLGTGTSRGAVSQEAALAALAEKDLMKLHVRDSSGKEVLSQAVDTDYDDYHKPDVLIFQSDFAPNETKTFTVTAILQLADGPQPRLR